MWHQGEDFLFLVSWAVPGKFMLLDACIFRVLYLWLLLDVSDVHVLTF